MGETACNGVLSYPCLLQRNTSGGTSRTVSPAKAPAPHERPLCSSHAVQHSRPRAPWCHRACVTSSVTLRSSPWGLSYGGKTSVAGCSWLGQNSATCLSSALAYVAALCPALAHSSASASARCARKLSKTNGSDSARTW
eukprot:scaffold10531_cov72-Phaeocystis_antarctica.AAC.7